MNCPHQGPVATWRTLPGASAPHVTSYHCYHPQSDNLFCVLTQQEKDASPGAMYNVCDGCVLRPHGSSAQRPSQSVSLENRIASNVAANPCSLRGSEVVRIESKKGGCSLGDAPVFTCSAPENKVREASLWPFCTSQTMPCCRKCPFPKSVDLIHTSDSEKAETGESALSRATKTEEIFQQSVS